MFNFDFCKNCLNKDHLSTITTSDSSHVWSCCDKLDHVVCESGVVIKCSCFPSFHLDTYSDQINTSHILIIPIHAKSKISRFKLASVAEQASLSLTWSQTLKTGFLVIWLTCFCFVV